MNPYAALVLAIMWSLFVASVILLAIGSQFAWLTIAPLVGFVIGWFADPLWDRLGR